MSSFLSVFVEENPAAKARICRRRRAGVSAGAGAPGTGWNSTPPRTADHSACPSRSAVAGPSVSEWNSIPR